MWGQRDSVDAAVFGGERLGSGAGGSPTAVAVGARWPSVVKYAGADPLPVGRDPSTHIDDVSGTSWPGTMWRFTVNDKPGILAQITSAYAKTGINIEGVLRSCRVSARTASFATTLEECPESTLDRALADVAQSDYHVQPRWRCRCSS